jgi:hypothetical protein
MDFGQHYASLAGDFSAGAAELTSNAMYTDAWRYVNTASAARYQVSAVLGTHKWFTAPSGTAGNAISFTQAMTLDASGNLSSGTTSIASSGQSNGITAGSVVAVKGALNSNTTATGIFEYNGDITRIRAYGATSGSGIIALNAGGGGGTADAERLRVDNTATAGNTSLLLYDVDNATMERVTVGIADSGGVGFKVLRIPN